MIGTVSLFIYHMKYRISMVVSCVPSSVHCFPGGSRFMECMMKIGLEYLSYHGNPAQQAWSPCLRSA